MMMHQRCRATRGKLKPSRCDLDAGHEDPLHFHDYVEGYHWWLRRGQKSIRLWNGLRATQVAGTTSQAEPWVLRMIAKVREQRAGRARERRLVLRRKVTA
jgi:hypothetical protein